jgi:putative endonuclease
VAKHYVYVLRSPVDRNLYVSLTNNLPDRLYKHNAGLVDSTQRRAPFDLIYWEGCLNRGDAAQREKYLKSAWGKRYLKTRLRRYLTG